MMKSFLQTNPSFSLAFEHDKKNLPLVLLRCLEHDIHHRTVFEIIVQKHLRFIDPAVMCGFSTSFRKISLSIHPFTCFCPKIKNPVFNEVLSTRIHYLLRSCFFPTPLVFYQSFGLGRTFPSNVRGFLNHRCSVCHREVCCALEHISYPVFLTIPLHSIKSSSSIPSPIPILILKCFCRGVLVSA